MAESVIKLPTGNTEPASPRQPPTVSDTTAAAFLRSTILYRLVQLIYRRFRRSCCYNGFPAGRTTRKIVHFPGDPGPHLTRGYWAHQSQQHKRHIDRFIRFCRAHACVQQTDHRPRYIDSNRQHLMLRIAMRPNNNNKSTISRAP